MTILIKYTWELFSSTGQLAGRNIHMYIYGLDMIWREREKKKKKLPNQLCHLETLSKREFRRLAEASLLNQHTFCNHSQNQL